MYYRVVQISIWKLTRKKKRKMINDKLIRKTHICFIYIILSKKKKETQHVRKYNLLQIFNIILNTEISITLLRNLANWLFRL